MRIRPTVLRSILVHGTPAIHEERTGGRSEHEGVIVDAKEAVPKLLGRQLEPAGEPCYVVVLEHRAELHAALSAFGAVDRRADFFGLAMKYGVDLRLGTTAELQCARLN